MTISDVKAPEFVVPFRARVPRDYRRPESQRFRIAQVNDADACIQQFLKNGIIGGEVGHHPLYHLSPVFHSPVVVAVFAGSVAEFLVRSAVQLLAAFQAGASILFDIVTHIFIFRAIWDKRTNIPSIINLSLEIFLFPQVLN